MLIFGCVDCSFSEVCLKKCEDGEQGLLCTGRNREGQGEGGNTEVSPVSFDHVMLSSQGVSDIKSYSCSPLL